jgi:hypothetical protein
METRDHVSPEDEYRRLYEEIMSKAAQQAVYRKEGQPAPLQSHFFPWEYSPYRANGSTTSQSGQ